MANIYIPEGLFDEYDKVVDDMIETLGVNCIIYYPSIQVACPFCSGSNIGNKHSNSHYHGGPNWVVTPGCNYCGGSQLKEQVNTDTIKLRVYFDPKDFINIISGIDIPNNTVQVIGYMSDLPNFNRADWVEINSDQSQVTKTLRYRRSQEALPHGFRRNRYFVAMLERE